MRGGKTPSGNGGRPIRYGVHADSNPVAPSKHKRTAPPFFSSPPSSMLSFLPRSYRPTLRPRLLAPRRSTVPGTHGADVSYRRDSPSNQRVITAPREVPVTHFLQTSRFYYMPALHMLVSADYLLRLLNRGAVTLRRHTFDDSYPQLGP